jgi:hypothetical protein
MPHGATARHGGAARRKHEDICPAPVVFNPPHDVLTLLRKDLGGKERIGLAVTISRQHVQLTCQLGVTLGAGTARGDVW